MSIRFRLFLLKLLSTAFILYISIHDISAQEGQTITARIVDELSQEPLAYALAYNLRSESSTSSDAVGMLSLPRCQVGDTILVSYLGYQDFSLVTTDVINYTVEMTSRKNILSEVVVTADDSYLYEIVHKIKKNSHTTSRQSKTYFYLESLVNDIVTEKIESYYNGTYIDHSVERIDLKKGRIGLRPLDNRFYINTESSRLFAMHNVFDRQASIPSNPLSLRRSALRKRYTLRHVKSFYNGDAEVIVIGFEASDRDQSLFDGRLWIDRTNDKLLKIDLHISDAEVYPFIQVLHYELNHVDMQITQTYGQVGDEQFIEEISFSYSYDYRDRFGRKIATSTTALLRCYDYENSFSLPYFVFSDDVYRDYKNIMAIPYDSVFWQQSAEYRLYEKIPAIDDFMAQYRLQNLAEGINSTHESGPIDWFQQDYVLWDHGRFTISEAKPAIIEKAQRLEPFDQFQS